MNIEPFSDAQTVKSGRKIGDGNFDFAHGEPESLRRKAVCRAYKRHRARNHSRGLKKVTPGMIDVFPMRAAHREYGRCIWNCGLVRMRRSQTLPQPFRAGDDFDEEVGKN